jgi:hypothetical protein
MAPIMKLTLFRSTKETDTFGFTTDPTGSNLPYKLALWRKAGEGGSADAYAIESLEGLALSDPVMRAIASDGFYLARAAEWWSRTPRSRDREPPEQSHIKNSRPSEGPERLGYE